jgi:hypothetical protein
MRRLVILLCTAVLAVACSEPPHKELDRAQGAIDAARAAGAERYAPDEFLAATGALAEAHEAVNQRDYRLALSLAVDANERAQAAAREAAGARARIIGERERALADTAAALKDLQTRIAAAVKARVPAGELKAAQGVADAAAEALQEARTRLGEDDQEAAARRLEGQLDAIREQISAVDASMKARTAPAGRRGR